MVPILSTAAAAALIATAPVSARDAPPLAVESAAGSSAQAGEGCLVTKDNGETFTDMTVVSCQAFYTASHPCSKAERPRACANQDMLKAVEPGGTDIVVAPHRGVWGMTLNPNAATSTAPPEVSVGGAPENAYSGVVAANEAGFNVVELDFIVMKDYKSGGIVTPLLGHFVDMAGFTDYPRQLLPLDKKSFDGADGFIMVTNWKDDYGKLILRDRNGSVPKEREGNYLIRAQELFSLIAANYPKTVVLVDVKFPKDLDFYVEKKDKNGNVIGNKCVAFCGLFPKEDRKKYSLEAIRAVAQAASSANAEANVVFKISQSNGLEPTDLERSLANFWEFSYAPQPLIGNKVDIVDITKWAEKWTSGYRKLISFWDTAIESQFSPQARPFTDESGGSYLDLMDYLQRTSGRRSAVWVTDPAGQGGKHANYAQQWVTIGNIWQVNGESDTRGDIMAGLYYSGARHLLITTDRPDLALQIRSQLEVRP